MNTWCRAPQYSFYDAIAVVADGPWRNSILIFVHLQQLLANQVDPYHSLYTGLRCEFIVNVSSDDVDNSNDGTMVIVKKTKLVWHLVYIGLA